MFFCGKGLGVFSVAILSNKWQQFYRRKTPKSFIVKNVTSDVGNKVIMIDIYSHVNTN